jgi:hypothetical protein
MSFFYGWEKPSPIQEASIPVALAGRYVGVVILMRYLLWLMLSRVIDRVSDPYSFGPDPDLVRIRIQHFRLNTDPDTIRIQGFHDQKL